MQRVFGYVRVSTDTQNKKGYGVASQEQAIVKYCKANKLNLIQTYYDRGISGTTADRDGLNDLFLTLNGIKTIVVLNTSRLWRDDFTKVYIKRLVDKYGVEIISIEQPTYSVTAKDPNDFLVNGMIELLDKYDRMNVNMKLTRGRKTKAKSGVKASGEAPIGYKWKHSKNQKPIIIEDTEQSDTVRAIFSQYLKLGSIQSVVKWLNANGHLTNRGKAFSPWGVSLILNNRFYLSEVTWKETVIKGSHPSLISPVVFGKAQAMLKRNGKGLDAVRLKQKVN